MKIDALKQRLATINDINQATAVLGWDQQVNMPPGGAEARGRQLGTLSQLAHEMFVAEETQRLLEEASAEIGDGDYESDDASLVRVVRQDLEQSTKIPAQLVAEIARVTTMAHETWANARAENDFAAFAPALQNVLDLTLKVAEHLGYNENPYDALVDMYDRGMTTDQITAIFDGHRGELVELIAAVSEVADRVDDSPVHQHFDQDRQRTFALWVVEQFGFDFQRGRQDIAVHPFATSFSRNDVRLTTRFEDDFLNPALFGLMHEAGHGMYEQGVGTSLESTPLANGTSLSVHESQSRMWENIVGRSKGFWSWALPKLKETFSQLSDVSLDDFYRAINKVERSFIRVEADEATYNLHIMLRFELENDLVNGRVKVADLPKEWNNRFEAFFGIVPPTDALGVLQDVHWSAGSIGYFPTYALGNLLSVQYYNQAVKEHPSILDEIASGKFDTLHNWLVENIHQHGRKFTTDELTRRITGESMQSGPYIEYLKTKFSEVYGL